MYRKLDFLVIDFGNCSSSELSSNYDGNTAFNKISTLKFHSFDKI